MRPSSLSLFVCLLAQTTFTLAAYNLVQDYSGSNFFSGWVFYDYYDNTTNGDVNFVSQANATAEHLAYINDAGNAVIRVDNSSDVIWNYKRDSVKITTQQSFGIGSLFIIDAIHLPYGCSVWPSFWTHGTAWPQNGEIDIIEAVNLMPSNQMALHSEPGCLQANGTDQSGQTTNYDCSTDAGCAVLEAKSNSYGAGFAQAGGGIFAAQFDTSGIYIWFWSRADVPSVITASPASQTMDTSSWGNPSAAYPSTSCNIADYFGAQYLVLDITLCGDWANSTYLDTCSGHGSTNICYNDNVIGPGSPEYDDAYFEIPFVRIYSTDAANSSSSKTLSGASPTATGSGSSASGSTSSAAALMPTSLGMVLSVCIALVIFPI